MRHAWGARFQAYFVMHYNAPTQTLANVPSLYSSSLSAVLSQLEERAQHKSHFCYNWPSQAVLAVRQRFQRLGSKSGRDGMMAAHSCPSRPPIIDRQDGPSK